MAVNNGASILIIGRTITESVEPIETIKKISRNIEECLES